MEIIKFNNQAILVDPTSEAEVSVMREIFKVREYRVAEKIITAAQEPILDVGAHVGFFTLYCRALNFAVPILALEPEANNLAHLREHLKANKYAGVKVVAGALAAQTGHGLLNIHEDSHNHRVVLSNSGLSGATTQPIATFSLADLCQTNQIERFSLIKMDIEGGEYDIFSAWTDSDYLLFKNIILEYHNYQGQTGEELETILREHGFGVQVFPSKFDKTMGIIFANNKRIKS